MLKVRWFSLEVCRKRLTGWSGRSDPSIGPRSDAGLNAMGRWGNVQLVVSKSSRSSLPAPPPNALVFVVDDDEPIRRSLSRLFRSTGLPAETFPSADSSLERAPHDGPSCLVLDLRMPGINGLELQQTLARREVQI